MPTGRLSQVKASGFSGNSELWSVSRSSGDQLSTSRPQQTPDSVPVATLGPSEPHHTGTARLHQVTAPRSSLHRTGHRSCADATPKLRSVSGPQETSSAPPDHSRLRTGPAGHTGPALSQQLGVPSKAYRPVGRPSQAPFQHLFLVNLYLKF